ncbi:hypothetical protein ZWY2020_032328 [Hordeum vulgare]|nr:hypothetical protein ZWY2020_032328 [Hordeum vulgare]
MKRLDTLEYKYLETEAAEELVKAGLRNPVSVQVKMEAKDAARQDLGPSKTAGAPVRDRAAALEDRNIMEKGIRAFCLISSFIQGASFSGGKDLKLESWSWRDLPSYSMPKVKHDSLSLKGFIPLGNAKFSQIKFNCPVCPAYGSPWLPLDLRGISSRGSPTHLCGERDVVLRGISSPTHLCGERDVVLLAPLAHELVGATQLGGEGALELLLGHGLPCRCRCWC